MHHGQLLKTFIHQSNKTIIGFSKEADMPARATIERDISQEFLPLRKRLLYAFGLRIRVESFELHQLTFQTHINFSGWAFRYVVITDA